ncbi:MAG: hypothetical protein ABIO40_10065 [Devosia sp.]
MVVAITSEPIGGGLTVGGERPRSPDRHPPGAQDPKSESAHEALAEAGPGAEPPLPDSTPGDAFTAAQLASEQPPATPSAHEIVKRFGSVWSPPSSDLKLTDRKV